MYNCSQHEVHHVHHPTLNIDCGEEQATRTTKTTSVEIIKQKKARERERIPAVLIGGEHFAGGSKETKKGVS